MIEVCTDVAEKEEAVGHAESERRHAALFRSCAQDLGLEIVEDVQAPYWRRIRGVFLEWAGRQDRVACLLLQGVMLESFAAALYQAVGEAVDGKMAQLFRRIAREEELHVEDGARILRIEYRRNPGAFEDKARRVHESVLPILVQMMDEEDRGGSCGLCRAQCMKKSLPRIRLSLVDLWGRSFRIYLGQLDALGLPGEVTRGWKARLPTELGDTPVGSPRPNGDRGTGRF
jgi:hypothetical protein